MPESLQTCYFAGKKSMKTKTKMEFNTILLRSLLDMTSIPTEQDHKQFENDTRQTIVLMFCYFLKHALLELDMCDKCKCKSNKLVWNITRRQTLLLHDNWPFTYWYSMIRTMYYENHKAGDNNKFLCKSNYGDANTWQSSLFGIMEVLED